ncbi:MAG: hypothetical protein GX879_06245 [Bacteroidales bacterium]|nr:hypothetical protein [Bacteroidales bacterium]
MNKKYVIILGSIFMVLIIVFGLTMYSQKKSLDLSFYDNLSSADRCEDLLQDNAFAVCCIKDEKFYRCTKREEFNPGEEIKILIDFPKFPEVEMFSDYNYVCLGTDINRKNIEGEIIFFPEECFVFSRESLAEISGVIPSADECMSCRRAPNDPYGIFTLLKINLYPDFYKQILVEKETEEGIVESDELTILNLKAKVSN